MPVRGVMVVRALAIPVGIAAYVGVAGLTGFCPSCKVVVDRVLGLAPGSAAAAQSQDEGGVGAIVAYTLDGEPVRLDGGTAGLMLVELFSTACLPCIEQRRVLVGMRGELEREGVRAVSVATDADPRKVRAFVGLHPGLGVDVMGSAETLGALMRAAGREAGGPVELPLLMVVDARGRVRSVAEGVRGAEEIGVVVRALE